MVDDVLPCFYRAHAPPVCTAFLAWSVLPCVHVVTWLPVCQVLLQTGCRHDVGTVHYMPRCACQCTADMACDCRQSATFQAAAVSCARQSSQSLSAPRVATSSARRASLPSLRQMNQQCQPLARSARGKSRNAVQPATQTLQSLRRTEHPCL